MLNFSEACERNKAPILEILQWEFADRTSVLEVGSGSGQHALYLAERLSHLNWQPSEVTESLYALEENLFRSRPENVRNPICLDVRQHYWPPVEADAVFSANTLHIISWAEVVHFFDGVGRVLSKGGTLAVYGPFRYHGAYTSHSNAQFDGWLKQRDPLSGLRNFEDIDLLAREQGLVLAADHSMPANNQLLVWRK